MSIGQSCALGLEFSHAGYACVAYPVSPSYVTLHTDKKCELPFCNIKVTVLIWLTAYL